MGLELFALVWPPLSAVTAGRPLNGQSAGWTCYWANRTAGVETRRGCVEAESRLGRCIVCRPVVIHPPALVHSGVKKVTLPPTFSSVIFYCYVFICSQGMENILITDLESASLFFKNWVYSDSKIGWFWGISYKWYMIRKNISLLQPGEMRCLYTSMNFCSVQTVPVKEKKKPKWWIEKCESTPSGFIFLVTRPLWLATR